MPGKHAPASPTSFYLSVARSVGGAVVAVVIVVIIAVLAVGSNDDGTGDVSATGAPTGTASPTSRSTRTASPSPQQTRSPLPAEETTVLVLNGTTRSGLAGRVSSRLEEAGYDMQQPGNAATRARTTIYYRGEAEIEARALLERYPEFGRVRRANARIPRGAMVTIVLGNDYDRDN